MAHLSSYYTLCPLIDQENLLGVQPDCDRCCAVVTLGKNIVIRYKLQDLKQVTSWSSKDRLVTPVIYDELSKNYVAAFNGKYIRFWEEKETNLDNVKKFKFSSPISAILTSKKISPIVVMRNGATASLAWALENRKSWNSAGVLLPEEKILQSQLVCVEDKIYLCMFTTKDEQIFSYVTVPLHKENYTEKTDQIVRIELKRSSERLVGHVIIEEEKNAYLLTLWSHGRLYSYSLTAPPSKSSPGTLISVITVVNTNHPVAMVALNEKTIALYGADALEEGAVLCIYNVQFKIFQAVQKLKLYTKEAKLWNIEEKLLLAANRHLAVAPYSLAQQRIEAMLGSTFNFKNNNSSEDEIEVIEESTVADWGTSLSNNHFQELPLDNLKNDISTKISTLLNEGKSNASIQEILIPMLIESKDIPSILWCLDNLKDLPEQLLVRLLAFCLSTTCIDVPVQNGFSENVNSDNHHEIVQNEFLNKILNICYSSPSIVSYLTTIKFEDILKLLRYLSNKLMDESFIKSKDCNYQSNSQLCEWIKVIIDSHYQHYLLTQDTEVLEIFKNLNKELETHLELMSDLVNLRPMIERLKNGQPIKSPPTDINRFYSIEEIKLY